MNLKRTLLFALLLANMGLVRAQFGRIFTPDDYLSSSLVNDIMQDQKGFVWLATQDGLDLYDGNTMTVFHKGDDSRLADNNINSVFQASDGTLYIGSNASGQLLDTSTDTFVDIVNAATGQPLQCNVQHIMQRSNGEVLLSTSGRGIYRIVGRQTAVRADLPGEYVRRITEDRNGRLWIATDNDGFYMVDGYGKGNAKPRSTHYILSDEQRSTIYGVVEDRQGNIYALSMTDGLYIYNNVEKRFQPVAATSGIRVSAVCLMPSGQLYLGSDGDGVKIYDPLTGTLTDKDIIINQAHLRNGKIHAIATDRHGNLWLGVYQRGVLMQPQSHSGFVYVGHKSATLNSIGDWCVMSVYRDSRGILWVGTDNGGLYGLDAEGHQKYHFPTPRIVMDICEAADGRLWVGTYQDGCGIVDPQTGAYTRMPFSYGRTMSVFSLCALPDGGMWLGTLGAGLMCYPPQPGASERRYQAPKGGIKSDRENALVNNFIFAIQPSRDGRLLYVGTSVGLACLDLQRGSFVSQFGVNHILAQNSINGIYEAPDGTIWAASPNGLFRVRNRGKDVRQYTTEDGLPNNNVRAIEADRNGHLWLSTNRGLAQMDIQKETFIHYSTGNGLQGNEFSNNASYSNGRDFFAFGGNNGLTLFNPADLQPENRQLCIYLTSLSTGEGRVKKGMQSGIYHIVDTAVIDATRFDLASNNNSFTLTFTAMEYNNPEQVVYQYRINGGRWHSLRRGTSEVNFSRLPAGRYDFSIRAQYNGLQSDERSFTVVIHPAWYASWWAYLAYLLLAALAVWQFVVYRRRRENARRQRQEHQHQQELNEAKIQFFMNISHEIRTPMTLIVSPLRHLIASDKDASRQHTYTLMHRNAERILNLINQLMDMRKIDKGVMPMNYQRIAVDQAIYDIFALFEPPAADRHIHYVFNRPDRPVNAWVDRPSLDKIVMNVLSNAFKNTNDGGEITLTLTTAGEHFRLVIADDGKHIDEDKLERIFDRFYQIAGTSAGYTGTGIGLHLTRQLVELHGGTITAHNAEQGCYFEIVVPLRNANVTDDAVSAAAVAAPVTADEPPVAGVLEAAAYGQAEETAASKATRKRRILIAEDDDEIRHYIATELAADYVVVEQPDGRQALDSVLQQAPDLVITDVMMPVMDGIALCQKLKKNVNTNHIPIVMLTARNAEEDRLQGLENGADAYIVKPFSIDILRTTVANLLQSRQLLRNKYSGQESQAGRVETVTLKSPDERLLERVMTAINKNMSNPELSVEFISQEVGISRAHLHRKLKELTNQSPRDFIRNIRLKQAAQLLAESNQNITEVMYAVGFQNAASFSTMFKNFYGVSPKEYAKQRH
ncbi:MAG: response regulator [Prevotella sp.]|nr:response regulator [Prevotella sp.]